MLERATFTAVVVLLLALWMALKLTQIRPRDARRWRRRYEREQRRAKRRESV